MQARRRRSHGPFFAREDRLVIGVVPEVRRAPGRDVGRKRHRPSFLDGLVENRTMKGKAQSYLAASAFFLDRGIELAEKADLSFVTETDDVPRLEALGRLDESAPAGAVDAPVQSCL